MMTGELTESEIEELSNALDKMKTLDGEQPILSSSDIDLLFKMIDEGDSEPGVHDDRGEISSYDFKRQSNLLEAHIKTIDKVYIKFCHLLSSYLAEQLHIPVIMKVASIDELTYEEFMRSLPTPTTLLTVGMAPLAGNAILEIDPVITVSINKQLRMSKNSSKSVTTKLITKIYTQMLEILNDAWQSIIILRSTIIQVDTDPQLITISQSDSYILVTMKTKIDDSEGMINFCIPNSIIKPIYNILSASDTR